MEIIGDDYLADRLVEALGHGRWRRSVDVWIDLHHAGVTVNPRRLRKVLLAMVEAGRIERRPATDRQGVETFEWRLTTHQPEAALAGAQLTE